MITVPFTIEQLIGAIEAVVECQRKIERLESAVTDFGNRERLRNKQQVLDQVRRHMTDALQVAYGEIQERADPGGRDGWRCHGCGRWIKNGKAHECHTP